jgi:dihydroorotase
MVEKLTVAPSRILGIDRGTLRVGAVADVTVFDDKETYKVDRSMFYSKSRNTPFHGFTLSGKVLCTIASGRIVYADRERMSLPPLEG